MKVHNRRFFQGGIECPLDVMERPSLEVTENKITLDVPGEGLQQSLQGFIYGNLPRFICLCRGEVDDD